MISFIKTNLRGMGQIMLQNNPVTGLFFLFGIFYNSWIMGIGALIGVLCGTLSAILFKYEDRDISDGLYGFNGALVGLALTFFFSFNSLLVILIIFFSALSSFVMNFMHKRNLSPFTFPFIFSTWIAIFLINYFNIAGASVASAVSSSGLNFLSAVSMGWGQVMFQGSVVTGIIFFVGVLINSRISAYYGVAGSLLGVLIGLLLAAPTDLLNIGIFGFNAVLCGIALAGSKKSAYVFALIAIIFSVLILKGFLSLNLIALTAPFVLATWITIFFKNRLVHGVV